MAGSGVDDDPDLSTDQCRNKQSEADDEREAEFPLQDLPDGSIYGGSPPAPPVGAGYATYIETPDCYETYFRPYLDATPVMTCIESMVNLTNREDIRSSPDGEPLVEVIHLEPWNATFLLHPRPEVHSPLENWSWERMRREQRYAGHQACRVVVADSKHARYGFVVWWIHPDWATPEWRQGVVELARRQRGALPPDTPRAPVRASRLHKPPQYLHTARDAPLPLLLALRDTVERWLRARLGGTPRLWYQYPPAPVKATLHLQASYGVPPDYAHERRVLALPVPRRPWYCVHPEAGTYRLLRVAPRQPVAPHMYVLGRVPMQAVPRPLLSFLHERGWCLPPTPAQHTMGAASLLRYAAQRVPDAVLQRLLVDGAALQLHGAPAALLPARCCSAAQPVPYAYSQWARGTCARRPVFLYCARHRVVHAAIMCGDDYVLHYATLVALRLLTATAAAGTAPPCPAPAGSDAGRGLASPDPSVWRRVRVRQYPGLQRQLAQWSRLYGAVQPGDVVLYGAQQAVAERLATVPGVRRLQLWDHAYHRCERWAVPCERGGVRHVALYEPYEHGWGDISARLAAALLQQGAGELLYLGKCATLESPDALYRLYCAERYALLRGEDPDGSGDDSGGARDAPVFVQPPNGLLRWRPALGTGMHAGVRCVAEQDFAQRERLDRLGARSLDLEAGPVARVCARAGVPFAMLLFATDYLRRASQHDLALAFDLANNREPAAERHRAGALSAMVAVVLQYVSRPLDTAARL